MATCAICDRWFKTPFAKRHTTPTTAQDTEAALVLGYWMRDRADPTVADRLCERHSGFLFQLDTIEESRKLGDVPAPTEQQLEFQRRAVEVTQRLAAVPSQVPQTPLPSGAALLGGANPAPSVNAPPVVPSADTTHSPPQHSQLTPPTNVPPPASDKPSFPCPICGQKAVAGELHRCEG